MSYEYSGNSSYGGLARAWGLGDDDKKRPKLPNLDKLPKPKKEKKSGRLKAVFAPGGDSPGVAQPTIRPTRGRGQGQDEGGRDFDFESKKDLLKMKNKEKEFDDRFIDSPAFQTPPGFMMQPPLGAPRAKAKSEAETEAAASSEEAAAEKAVAAEAAQAAAAKAQTPEQRRLLLMRGPGMMPGARPMPMPIVPPRVTSQQARLGTLAAAIASAMLLF